MLNLSDEYDHKALFKYLFLLGGVTLVYMLSKGMAMVVLPLIVLMALVRGKSVELIFWIFFMTITSIGNRQIFCNRALPVMIVRVTLLLATMMMSFKAVSCRASRANTAFLGILLYILWEAGISLQGYEPIVSYLKLSLFFCIFLGLYGAASVVNATTTDNVRILRSVLLSVVLLMIVGSAALIPIPSIGLMAQTEDTMLSMMRGEITSLFCGMCSHSQAMGPMCGVVATMVFADFIFSVRKFDPLYLLVLGSAAIVCYQTSSRTGMGAMLAGIGFVSFLFIRSNGQGSRWKGKIMALMALLVVVGGIAVVSVPSLRDRIAKFALKWGGEQQGERVTFENVIFTRNSKMEEALWGFRRNPVLGNGFQVSYDMKFEHRSTLVSYLAAPIEKGIWIFAILEEGGAVGFVLFVGWLIVLFPVLIARKAYVMAGTFFAVMTALLGEFSIFSMTYLGGFYWALVFSAGCLDVGRLKNQGLEPFWVPGSVVYREVISRGGQKAWFRRLG